MNRYHESADYIKTQRLKRHSIAYCLIYAELPDLGGAFGAGVPAQ